MSHEGRCCRWLCTNCVQHMSAVRRTGNRRASHARSNLERKRVSRICALRAVADYRCCAGEIRSRLTFESRSRAPVARVCDRQRRPTRMCARSLRTRPEISHLKTSAGIPADRTRSAMPRKLGAGTGRRSPTRRRSIERIDVHARRLNDTCSPAHVLRSIRVAGARAPHFRQPAEETIRGRSPQFRNVLILILVTPRSR